MVSQKASLPLVHTFLIFPSYPPLKQRMVCDDVISMKPKCVCVHARELSRDISNWEVQGHSSIYMLDHLLLHCWQ